MRLQYSVLGVAVSFYRDTFFRYPYIYLAARRRTHTTHDPPNSFFGKCAAGFRSSAVPAPPLLNPTHWPRSRVPWLGTGFGDSRVNEVTRRGHSLGWTGCSVTVDVKHHLGVCPAKPNLQSSTNKAMLCDADERQGGDSP